MRRIDRVPARPLLAALMIFVTASVPACMADGWVPVDDSAYHVAPGGNDTSDGSALNPWETIQHAANVLQPGETVYIHGGVYRERVRVDVSGDPVSGPVTFAAFPGHRPILDGMGLPIPDDLAAMILIEDRSHILIEGIEIRNYRATNPDDFPAGILLIGAPQDVTIRNCILHDIGNNLAHPNGNGPFANGIAVYGTQMQPASGIRILDNELYDIEVGGSEVLVINGNVEGFMIAGNHIHHVNNIAIDCIGFEGMAPAGAINQARNGVVRGNRIENTSGLGNAYYDDPYGALGIYVDGGRDILIDGNTILRTDFGIEISSEHIGRKASNITIINNVIAESRTVGLSIGGWIDEWGGAENVAIVNNTFYHNNALQDWHGEVAFVRHIDGVAFVNNIVVANAQGVFLLNEARTGDAIDSHHNLFYSAVGDADGVWIWNTTEFETFVAYRAESGNDGSSLAADPHFRAPGIGEFDLRSDSPAIDAGSNHHLPEEILVDHALHDRFVDGDGDSNAVVDIGAFEYSPLPE